MTGLNKDVTGLEIARSSPRSMSSSSSTMSSTAASSGQGSSWSKTNSDVPLLVLKVGTSSLMVNDESGQRVHLANVSKLVALISELHLKGYQVVLVSSGAVGMGCMKLGLKEKPTCPRKKQAVAAAGQSQLMRMYEDLFGTVNLQVAQFLLNQSDFMNKDHWRNVKATIQACLGLGIVPIVNENDSTNTAQLRFGDNDNLAALTAVQLKADALFLFTDVDHLYTANPRTDPDAKALQIVSEPWALQVDTSNPGSGLGTGGMLTKIVAARTAAIAGIPCGLINGKHPARLHSFLEYGVGLKLPGMDAEGESLCGDRTPPKGTYFMAMALHHSVGNTRRWILSLPATAEVSIDDGCAKALANKGNCLPVGILKVHGAFERNGCVKIVHRGSEIGRALVNYSSEELGMIRGVQSNKFEDILGYRARAEACNRGNMILTVDPASLRGLFMVSEPLGGEAVTSCRSTRATCC